MKLPNCHVFAKFEKMLICTACVSHPSSSRCHNRLLIHQPVDVTIGFLSINQPVDVTIGFLSINHWMSQSASYPSINQWMSQSASYPSTSGCHNRLLIHQSTSGCHNQLLIHQPVDVIIGNEWKLTNQHVVSLYWTGCVHNHEEVHMC